MYCSRNRKFQFVTIKHTNTKSNTQTNKNHNKDYYGHHTQYNLVENHAA